MITIIGEGATERYYFTHLKRLRGYNYTCKPRNFTEQTFDEMQKQIDGYLAMKVSQYASLTLMLSVRNRLKR